MISSLSPDVLAQVFETLPVRIFWKDLDSRFLGCNRRFAEDAGMTDPQEFIGKSDYYFYHPDQAKAFRDDDADVMYSGQARLGIIEKLTKANSEEIWLETNKWPMRDADGNVSGIMCMYQDITARIVAAEARCAACGAETAAA